MTEILVDEMAMGTSKRPRSTRRMVPLFDIVAVLWYRAVAFFLVDKHIPEFICRPDAPWQPHGHSNYGNWRRTVRAVGMTVFFV